MLRPDRRHSEIAANSSKQNIDIIIKDQPQISAEICTKSTNKRGRPKKSRNSIDIGELTQVSFCKTRNNNYGCWLRKLNCFSRFSRLEYFAFVNNKQACQQD